MLATKPKLRTELKHRKLIKKPSSRFTFTLSGTDELNSLMDYFDVRLQGLNRGEIVKLALIELRQSLAIKDKSSSTPVFLTNDEETSLGEAINSPKSKPMTANEMMQWLEN